MYLSGFSVVTFVLKLLHTGWEKDKEIIIIQSVDKWTILQNVDKVWPCLYNKSIFKNNKIPTG